jgi:aminopeptidase N
VARKKFKGINIEVYYIKEHAYNVPNMLSSIEKSLDYYTTHFGPYYHKQARIIEFPRYASFAQAFPGTMPYSEGIGFIQDLRDVKADDIDMVFYIVAHEMAHQYWAHQLCGASMQGSEWMSEGFSQYAALMVMEKEFGREKMKKFLKYEMDGYLTGRSSEFEAERPIYKTEGQAYIHYQKASVAMYYLKEMIGENNVNLALQKLLTDHAYKEPPYATSMNAIQAFEEVTPDSLKYLVDDLFKHITLFSNRIESCSFKKNNDSYVVTMNVVSEKYRSDSLGKEQPIPVNDYIDIAIFGEKNQTPEKEKVLLHNRVKLNARKTRLVFSVNELPKRVGVDPYHYLIDRVPDDNTKNLTSQ